MICSAYSISNTWDDGVHGEVDYSSCEEPHTREVWVVAPPQLVAEHSVLGEPHKQAAYMMLVPRMLRNQIVLDQPAIKIDVS